MPRHRCQPLHPREQQHSGHTTPQAAHRSASRGPIAAGGRSSRPAIPLPHGLWHLHAPSGTHAISFSFVRSSGSFDLKPAQAGSQTSPLESPPAGLRLGVGAAARAQPLGACSTVEEHASWELAPAKSPWDRASTPAWP
ncbi:unnamed protein product [Ectocarpus sp. 12 AP-2014]